MPCRAPAERMSPGACARLARVLRRITILVLTMTAIAGAVGLATAEDSEITTRRIAERKNFTDAEIKDGFFKIAFGAELEVGPRVERIRKFDGPVRVYVIDHGMPDRRRDVATVIADIRSRVEHLDVAMTQNRHAANVVVRLVRQREFKRTVRSTFGVVRARQIEELLSPQCLSGFAKDQNYRIVRAEVILPVDAGEFMFYDCAYEELLQAMGPINDDRSVPWTMFNDDVQMGFFDSYDQYLLNILYDPRVLPGMTKQEVAELLPKILPTVRATVSRVDAPSRADLQAGRNLQ